MMEQLQAEAEAFSAMERAALALIEGTGTLAGYHAAWMVWLDAGGQMPPGMTRRPFAQDVALGLFLARR